MLVLSLRLLSIESDNVVPATLIFSYRNAYQYIGKSAQRHICDGGLFK